MARPAYVHPSALSPQEHDAYAAWVEELEGQVSRLGRGMRFGEMLAFVRKRTPVEREQEVRAILIKAVCVARRVPADWMGDDSWRA